MIIPPESYHFSHVFLYGGYTFTYANEKDSMDISLHLPITKKPYSLSLSITSEYPWGVLR